MPIVKKLGETPLEALRSWQKNHPEYAGEKIGYAGRLDPMAEGLLLLLIGEANKRRRDFENLDKTYVFEVVFGISTDTHDLLGLVTNQSAKRITIDDSEINAVIMKFTGPLTQQYPVYSSKPVQGRPLFWWARQNKLNGIKIPSHSVTISSLKYAGLRIIKDPLSDIFDKIGKIHGLFRQDQICHKWNDIFQNFPMQNWQIHKFTVVCSSGTYVRQLAHDMGKSVGRLATAYSITRTRIGPYSLYDNT